MKTLSATVSQEKFLVSLKKHKNICLLNEILKRSKGVLSKQRLMLMSLCLQHHTYLGKLIKLLLLLLGRCWYFSYPGNSNFTQLNFSSQAMKKYLEQNIYSFTIWMKGTKNTLWSCMLRLSMMEHLLYSTKGNQPP